MQGRKVIAAAGALLALVIAIAGCGSSGNAAEASAEGTISKAEYLKLAIPICKLGVNEITNKYGLWEKQYTDNGKQPPHAGRAKALSEASLAARKKQLERLQELELPRGSAWFVKRIYAAWEEGIERGERDLSSMLGSYEDFAFGNAYRMSLDYGLKACWWD